MNKILTLYSQLITLYGPQGWFPLVALHEKNRAENRTKTGSTLGYHVNDYAYPKTQEQIFEICLGCILTQNTAWLNVQQALLKLNSKNALSVKGINNLTDDELKELIRPAGYYNQKAIYIREFSQFFQKIMNSKRHNKEQQIDRKKLLQVKGIGPETADTILLYAFAQPEFVIDTYTKRILLNLNIIKENQSYDEVKKRFVLNLEKEIDNTNERLICYQEYHALLVEHGKRYYQKKPYGIDCPLVKRQKGKKAKIMQTKGPKALS